MKSHTDSFQSSEGINAHADRPEDKVRVRGTYASSSNNRYAGLTVGENSSRHTEERKARGYRYRATVVSKDGDVIWSATAKELWW